MSKNKFKTLNLFCFLLVFSLLFSPIFSPLFAQNAIEVHLAGATNGDVFDYASVMSEPRAYTGGPESYASLTQDQIKNMKLYTGGIPFGVKFMTEGILIVGFCDIASGNKSVNPSQSAGLKEGDRIISVDGCEIFSSLDLIKRIEQSEGKALSIVYLRGSDRRTTSLRPVYCEKEQCYKSGLYVKDNGAGIGTVTYIDPKTLSFGGLGHGICDAQSGELVPIQRGSIVNVSINGAIKGQSGAPGEVKGSFRSGKIGTLTKNTGCGVYGVYASLPQGLPTEPLSLCPKSELREGKAYIYCTLDDSGPQKYEIEISRINRGSTEGKSFTVKVADPKLIEKTGGIVQGMSGSPIIQNGRLAGAVTHVLINDPTTGYGIFIENMLNAANTQVMPKAA